MNKCVTCNRGRMRPHDYGFMIREVCDYCGFIHDTPRENRKEEYEQFMRQKNEHYFKLAEGEE